MPEESKSHFYRTVQLAEPVADANVSSIQLMKAGTFKHAWFGKMVICEKMFSTMIKNFDDNVRGIDLSVDCDHMFGPAEGWFRGLRMNE